MAAAERDAMQIGGPIRTLRPAAVDRTPSDVVCALEACDPAGAFSGTCRSVAYVQTIKTGRRSPVLFASTNPRP